MVPLSWDLFRIVDYIVIGTHSGMLSKYLSRGTVICKRWCCCLDKSVVSAWWTCYIIGIFLGSFRNLWKQWAFLFEIAYQSSGQHNVFFLLVIYILPFFSLTGNLSPLCLLLSYAGSRLDSQLVIATWLTLCLSVWSILICVRFFFFKKMTKLRGFVCLGFFLSSAWYIAWQKVRYVVGWGQRLKLKFCCYLLKATHA